MNKDSLLEFWGSVPETLPYSYTWYLTDIAWHWLIADWRIKWHSRVRVQNC